MNKALGIVIAVLAVNSALAQELKVTLRNLKMNVKDNPYFDNWSGEIVADDTMSMKTPVKSDLPEDMRMTVKIEFDGNVVADSDMLVCDAFDDETVGKDVLAKGLPEDTFPKSCPVKAGTNFEVNKYVVDKEKIPDSAPDGPFMADITIYMPDQDPVLEMHVDGDISHGV